MKFIAREKRYQCQACKQKLARQTNECYACGESGIKNEISTVTTPYYVDVFSLYVWWNPLTWGKTEEREIK